MLCKPLLETIFRGSLRFVAPNSSYCLLDYNYNWFNSSDYVAISQLEMARRFHTECPIIPGKGNCTCTPEHMLSTVNKIHKRFSFCFKYNIILQNHYYYSVYSILFFRVILHGQKLKYFVVLIVPI